MSESLEIVFRLSEISVWPSNTWLNSSRWFVIRRHLKKICPLHWTSPHAQYGVISGKLCLNFCDLRSNPDLSLLSKISCCLGMESVTEDEITKSFTWRFRMPDLNSDTLGQDWSVASNLFHSPIHKSTVVLRKDWE